MTLRWTGLLAIFLAVTLPVQAQVAGRILLAVGEVSAERGGQIIALAKGSTVERGDLIRVGNESNAQIRFSDAGIMALRAKTEFRIDNYRFAAEDSALSQLAFSLIRGGFRTITGLIGSKKRENYLVRAPLATVGIRGTSYTLIVCQQDCLESDGSLAPDGNYGVVQEGRVSVTNDAGTVEFGVDEAFYVADLNTPPRALVGRPAFLRDRLAARVRQQREAAMLAAREVALAEGRRLERGDLRVVGGTPLAPIAAAELRDASGNVAVLGPGLGVGIAWSAGAEERAQVEGGVGTVIVLDGQTKLLEGYSIDRGRSLGGREKAAFKDLGGIPGDGGMAWGRWEAGAPVAIDGQGLVPPTGVHFIYGNLAPPAAIAASAGLRGTLQYDYVGGPRPTDGAGNVGQFLSGSFGVNFLDRTIAGGVIYQVGSTTYTIPVPDNTPLIGGAQFVGFELNRNNAGTWRCACNNTAGSIDAVSISGLFMGSRAQGLGVMFSTRDAIAGRTAGAAAFKCTAGRC